LTFGRSFAELSRKYPYHPLSTDPSHQQGGAPEEKQTPRALVFGSQSLTFGSLAAAFGACFLRLQKATLGSTSGRCKDVLWRSLTCGNLAATYEGKGKSAVPFSCRTPGGRR